MKILYPDDAGVIQTIDLVDLETSHEWKTTPTDHAVEDGANISDHLRVELDAISTRVMITNSLIEPAGSHMNGATSATSSASTAQGSISILGLSAAVDRVQLVFSALDELRRQRRLVTIETTHKRYESMCLTSLVFPETNTDGMEVTIEARQVRVVSTRTTTNPRPQQVRGHRRAQAGTVATTPATTSTAATPPSPPPNRSLAAQAVDSIF